MPKKGADKAARSTRSLTSSQASSRRRSTPFTRITRRPARRGSRLASTCRRCSSIVVCNNTATSKLVYEWIAGFERPNADGEAETRHVGQLRLFRNYDDNRQRLAKPNTLLIDSEQLESGEALDPAFRDMMGPEIEQFRRERIERGVDAVTAAETTDADLLREVMNTVGRMGASASACVASSRSQC